MTRVIAIVEGHGDAAALPVLLQRISARLAPGRILACPKPIRVPKTRLVKEGEIERAVELAARQSSAGDAILVVLDADDECPARLGPKLLSRARKARPDRSISVVLAKREFESWFLAAAPSIAGQRNLLGSLEPPADPEAIKDAKRWLVERSRPGQPYRETIDQRELARVFDLSIARRAPSFDKLWRVIEALLGAARP